MPKYDILILGAWSGSLLASKMMFGGHNVTLVCLPPEADLIDADGFRVRMPIRGRKEPVEINSRKLPGKVLVVPSRVTPSPYSIPVLQQEVPDSFCDTWSDAYFRPEERLLSSICSRKSRCQACL